MRYLQNTVMVLALSILTAGAVYAGVNAVSGTSLGSTIASSAGTQTCPATGCTASSCHATSGATGAFSADGSGTYGTGRHRGWGSGEQQYEREPEAAEDDSSI